MWLAPHSTIGAPKRKRTPNHQTLKRNYQLRIGLRVSYAVPFKIFSKEESLSQTGEAGNSLLYHAHCNHIWRNGALLYLLSFANEMGMNGTRKRCYTVKLCLPNSSFEPQTTKTIWSLAAAVVGSNRNILRKPLAQIYQDLMLNLVH